METQGVSLRETTTETSYNATDFHVASKSEMTDHRARHLAESNKRRRAWDTRALLRLVEMASGVAYLDSPDWSAPHAVYLVRRETSEPFAMIRTDHPVFLRVVLPLSRDIDARSIRKRLGVPFRKTTREATFDRYELRITNLRDINSSAFRELFAHHVMQFEQLITSDLASPVNPVAFIKLATRGELELVDEAIATDDRLAREPKAILGAAARGHADVVRLLLVHGADSNTELQLSSTIQSPNLTLRKMSIHQAAGELQLHSVRDARRRPGHFETVRILLEAGADIEARATRQEVSPLLSACMGGSSSMAQLLLASGARRTVFVLAALGETRQLYTRLRRSPNLVRRKDTNGMTALMYCAASRLGIDDSKAAASLAETAEFLITSGAELAVRRENYWAGESPHHLDATSFAALGNPEVLSVLLDHGVRTEIGGNSFSAIGQAVMSRSEATLCLLMAHQLGVGVEDPRFAQWSSTHWLAASVDIVDDAEAMARWFLKKRILNCAACDAYGQSPLDVARSRGFGRFASLLNSLR